jgi:hypothetical protein
VPPLNIKSQLNTGIAACDKFKLQKTKRTRTQTRPRAQSSQEIRSCQEQLREQGGQNTKLWALQALISSASRTWPWPVFFLCCWLSAHKSKRGAPKKNKIESDVYLADDKWGR